MTVTSSTNEITYVGNGTNRSFPFSFYIDSLDDLYLFLVDENGTEIAVSQLACNITGIGNENGGNIYYPLMGTALSSAYRFRIRRKLSYTQETSLENQGMFYPEVIEAALDKGVILTQQIIDDIAGIQEQLNAIIKNALGAAYQASIIYQGASATDPTTRQDGSALQAGDFYFNTITLALRVYSGTAWSSTTLTGMLAAINNLSDVVDPLTALTNLGGAPLDSPAFTGTPTVSGQALATTSGFVPKITYYTNGSGVHTTDPKTTAIEIELIGAGGGGGGYTGTGPGVAGGDTVFGSYSAKGGSGGAVSPDSGTGGAGGAGGGPGSGTANLRISGGPGGGATSNFTSTGIGQPPALGGAGAAGPFGGAGMPDKNNTRRDASANSGAGGAGVSINAVPFSSGGGGGAGEYVRVLLPVPTTTYAYSVGGGGAGYGGGNGGSGLIVVREILGG